LYHGGVERIPGGYKLNKNSSYWHTKGMVRTSGRVLLVAAGLTLAGCVTQTGSDPDGPGWLKQRAALSENKRMSAKGMKPVSIDCKFDEISNGAPMYSVKIKWGPNKPSGKFRWAVGGSAYIAKISAEAEKEGLHKVFSKPIVSPMVQAACVLWES
jgi:hypothetical protein